LTITIRTFLIKVYFAGIAITSLFAIAWRLSFANHLKLIDGLSTVQDWLWPTSFFLMRLQSGDSLSTQAWFYSFAILSNGVVYVVVGVFVYIVFQGARNFIRDRF